MRFHELIQAALKAIPEVCHSDPSDVVAAIETEILSHGITLGSTALALSIGDTTVSTGCIVDISYHNYYGYHAVWIGKSAIRNGDTYNCFITASAETEISVIC